MRLVLSTLSVFLLLGVSAAGATEYKIDPAHSNVTFKIRHLVSKTSGSFEKVTGTINHEKGKPETWVVNAEIDATSINTGNKKRDDHLRSRDFFDVKKYPKITFKSTKVEDADEDSAKLIGDLTMHGVTKPVTLDVQMGGEGVDPMGTKKIGFSAKTKLDRKDFGIVFNKVLDAGGTVLGDDVEINLEIEADAAAPKLADDKAAHGKKTTKSKK